LPADYLASLARGRSAQVHSGALPEAEARRRESQNKGPGPRGSEVLRLFG